MLQFLHQPFTVTASGEQKKKCSNGSLKSLRVCEVCLKTDINRLIDFTLNLDACLKLCRVVSLNLIVALLDVSLTDHRVRL